MLVRPLILIAAPLLLTSFIAESARAQTTARQNSGAPQINAPQTGNGGKIGVAKIAGVAVDGLSPADAKRRITRELAPKLGFKLKLSDGKRAIYRTRRDLNVDLNVSSMIARAAKGEKFVPLQLKVNPLQLQKTMRRLTTHFDFEGRDARLLETKNGGVKIVADQASRKLDVPTSAFRAAAKINGDASVRVLDLVSKTTPRRRTSASFKGIDGVLASYSTDFSASNVKRTTNMRVAIRAIDGTILKPNEIFSLNKTVGERTQARGYRTSIIFVNGYKVPGLGAGVSQVTGTLFNAALLAALPIVEHRLHSRPVAYLPQGRDATVAWGNFDMKFKNNTGAPIYIAYSIDDSTVRAVLFGKRTPNQKVSLRVRRQEKGERQISTQLYRTIRRGDKIIKERVGSHTYKWNVGAWEE